MELKCVVAKPILRYIEKSFGSERAGAVIREAGLDFRFLDDANNWMSYEYFCILLRKLVEATGNPRAPFEAAVQHTDRSSYGAVGMFYRHVGAPMDMYRLIVRFNRLFHRIGEFTITDTGPNTCTIRVRMPHHPQIRENCLAIQGSLAVIPREYGLPVAQVEELACACDGKGDACVYRLTWMGETSRRNAFLWATAATAAVCVAITAIPGFWVKTACAVLAFACGYFVRRAYDHRRVMLQELTNNRDQASSLMETLQAAEKLNAELQRRVEERTERLRNKTQELEYTLGELRASRERELLAEQQATLGVVAGGMAHELNSPLNAVLLSLQELGEDLPGDGLEREPLMRAERASMRCKRIINDLLICSREPRRDLILQVRDIVRDTISLYEREHPGEIRVVRRFADDIPRVALDQIQIQHVVTNLLKNASDAMGGRGGVDVELYAEGDSIVFRVSDTGPGVPDEEKERIFLPLHSTKGGRGLGLGLSITRQLVWRNNGTIAVQDREGGGAAFVVKFPIQRRNDTAAGGLKGVS